MVFNRDYERHLSIKARKRSGSLITGLHNLARTYELSSSLIALKGGCIRDYIEFRVEGSASGFRV